jgi:hypothetical protein
MHQLLVMLVTLTSYTHARTKEAMLILRQAFAIIVHLYCV